MAVLKCKMCGGTKVLDLDPKNGSAYVARLMAKLHVRRREDLAACKATFVKDPLYQKALRFGDAALVAELTAAAEKAESKKKQAAENATGARKAALKRYGKLAATTVAIVLVVAVIVGSIQSLKSYMAQRREEKELALAAEQEQQRIEAAYAEANTFFEEGKYREALAAFRSLDGYEDSTAMEERCAVELINAQFAATADHDTAVKHLENLKLYDTEQAEAYYAEGWYMLYTKAMEAEDAARAEACLAKLSDQEDLETLTQETEKLQTYLEAKAISVTNMTTRNQLEELLNKLPEDYKEAATLRASITDFDEKQTAAPEVPAKPTDVPAAPAQTTEQTEAEKPVSQTPQEPSETKQETEDSILLHDHPKDGVDLSEQYRQALIGSWGYSDLESKSRPQIEKFRLNADGTYWKYKEQYWSRPDPNADIVFHDEPIIVETTGTWWVERHIGERCAVYHLWFSEGRPTYTLLNVQASSFNGSGWVFYRTG